MGVVWSGPRTVSGTSGGDWGVVRGAFWERFGRRLGAVRGRFQELAVAIGGSFGERFGSRFGAVRGRFQELAVAIGESLGERFGSVLGVVLELAAGERSLERARGAASGFGGRAVLWGAVLRCWRDRPARWGPLPHLNSWRIPLSGGQFRLCVCVCVCVCWVGEGSPPMCSSSRPTIPAATHTHTDQEIAAWHRGNVFGDGRK